MTQKINPVPKGYRTITPGLVVRGVDQAIEFYEQVFGATTGARQHDEGGNPVGQVELKIGGSLILLGEELPEWGVLSPLAIGATPVGQKVFIADPDAVYDRAIEAGAMSLQPMTRIGVSERSDERIGRFVDPFGHVWTVAARVPAEARPAAETTVAPEASTEASTDAALGHVNGAGHYAPAHEASQHDANQHGA